MLQITSKIIIIKKVNYIYGNQYGNTVSAPEAAGRVSLGTKHFVVF